MYVIHSKEINIKPKNLVGGGGVPSSYKGKRDKKQLG